MVPKRSAIAPASGCPAPHRMFWIASAKPNTSRSQPLACDIGVRKNPRLARGPKLKNEITQPHTTITAGVRQPMVVRRDVEGVKVAISANPCEPGSDLRRRDSQERNEIQT